MIPQDLKNYHRREIVSLSINPYISFPVEFVFISTVAVIQEIPIIDLPVDVFASVFLTFKVHVGLIDVFYTFF